MYRLKNLGKLWPNIGSYASSHGKRAPGTSSRASEVWEKPSLFTSPNNRCHWKHRLAPFASKAIAQPDLYSWPQQASRSLRKLSLFTPICFLCPKKQAHIGLFIPGSLKQSTEQSTPLTMRRNGSPGSHHEYGILTVPQGSLT